MLSEDLSPQAARLLAERRLDRPEPALVVGLHGWLEEPLRGCTDGAIREIRTVLGELLTNAFQHACPPFAVRLFHSGDSRTVRMEVDDGLLSTGTGWLVHRGLRLVRGLSESWGVERLPEGKTVWAELPVLVPPDGH